MIASIIALIHVCEVNQGGDRECECKNKALANARENVRANG